MIKISFYILLPAFISAAPALAQERPLTILSSNILYCNPVVEREPYALYMTRLDQLIDKINTLKPDILALQEVANCEFWWGHRWVEPPKIIAQKTGYHYAHWASEGRRRLWEEGTAFFWNPNKVHFKNIRCQNLKSTVPGHVGGGLGFKIVRSLCRGDITLADGRLLRVFNTHLTGKIDLHVREILDIMGQEAPSMDAAILAGDFNLESNDPSIQLMRAVGLNQVIYNHVDYIFSWNLPDPKTAKVLDFKSDRTSDHDALWLSLSVQ